MTPTRRDILKGISGAALATATQPLVSLTTSSTSQQATPPPPMETVVIINGTFGIAFTPSELVAFAPNIMGHTYKVDDTPISRVDRPRDLHLIVSHNDTDKKPIADYQAGGYVFRPDREGFSYNDAHPPFVRIHLPYPKAIFPHRLLAAAIDTPTMTIPIDIMAGALALLYPIGSQPSIQELSYTPVSSSGYFRIMFAAENRDVIHIPPEVHARMAWDGLKQHFNGMGWNLRLSGYSEAKAPVAPYDVSDDQIELTYPLESLSGALRSNELHGIVRSTAEFVAKAANCKSPIFVTSG